MMRIVVLILAGIILTGCGKGVTKEPSSSYKDEVSTYPDIETDEDYLSENANEVYIGDEHFVAQLDEIFEDVDEYVGKKIHLEGIVSKVEENTLGYQYAVTRYYDVPDEDHVHTISVGINCTYDGEWPKEGAWVEIIGVLETEDIDGAAYPIIRITEIIPKAERGQEKVTG